MKLVLKDNFDRENVNDRLLAESVPEYCAEFLANSWNSVYCTHENDDRYCVVKPDDYKLFVWEP